MAMDVDADADVTLVQSADEEEEEEEEEEGPGKADEEEDEDEDEEEEEEEVEGQGKADEEEEEEEDVFVVSDTEDDDVEEVVGQKRKRKGTGKAPTKKPIPARDIEYKISIFTPAQMKKSKSSRGPPVTEIVNLKSNQPWSSLKTWILTSINEALEPFSLDLHAYNITFTVPRQASDPILLGKEKYAYLVKKALLIQKNPSAKIVVEPKAGSVVNKENDANGDESDTNTNAKKGGRKTKACAQGPRHPPCQRRSQ
ncbi:hypothetical protein B0H13DRAFT_1850756 [Mycena leptocephala]|nr:hypothetical protein B0H13DRAFT_1850756 [Mycena leptocephala]